MAGELHIYFHSGGQSNAEEVVNVKDKSQEQQITNATTPKASNSTKGLATSAIMAVAVDTGKKMLMYGTSVIGDLSGDYIAQQNINDTINMVGTAINMLNFPVGTIASSVQIAQKFISTTIERNNKNQEIELLRQRTGNSSLDDKGTEQ